MDVEALEGARRKSMEVLCCYAREDQRLLLGMVISFLFVLFGILGSLLGREGIFTNLWFWDLFFFLGLMIFFIAIVGWSPFFILKAGKTRAAIGKLIGIIAILLGVFITVVGAILASARPSSPDGAAGTIVGIISIIAGIVIWWVARIPRDAQRDKLK